MAFVNGAVSYRPAGTAAAEVVISRRRRSLLDVFREDPPAFSTGAFMVNDALFELTSDYRPPYERNRIEVLDWTGVDIREESQ